MFKYTALRTLGPFLPARALSFAGGYPCCCADEPGSGSSTSSIPPGSTSTQAIGVVPCPVCVDEIVASWFRIDLAGIASDTGLCTGSRTCADLNGSYVVGPIEQVAVVGGTICTAAIEHLPGVCRPDDSCFSFLRLLFEKPDSGIFAGHYLVVVELVSTNMCDEGIGEPVMTFQHDFGTESPPDCVNSFPLVIEGGEVEFTITPKCAAASATCTITAIPPP